MTHTPHELHEEFPQDAAAIHALKQTNAHFARLAEEYHKVNRALHRAETRAEIVSPEAESELRHHRVFLKDEIWRLLKAEGPKAVQSTIS
jgi:uncharacterized protein YdcH (DUF465 family)